MVQACEYFMPTTPGQSATWVGGGGRAGMQVHHQGTQHGRAGGAGQACRCCPLGERALTEVAGGGAGMQVLHGLLAGVTYFTLGERALAEVAGGGAGRCCMAS